MVKDSLSKNGKANGASSTNGSAAKPKPNSPAKTVKNGASSSKIDVQEKLNPETKQMEKYYDMATVPTEFRANGLQVVKMRVINHPDEDGPTFQPQYVYQFFPEPHEKSEFDEPTEMDSEPEPDEDNEDDDLMDEGDSIAKAEDQAEEVDENEGLIIGYKDLQVELAFTPATLQPHITIKLTKSLPPAECSVPDLGAAIALFQGHRIMTTSDALVRAVKEDQQFKPFGNKIQEWKITSKTDNSETVYELYEVGLDSVHLGYPPKFAEYLADIQPFLAWFVYAARVVTADDTNWLHYFSYQKHAEYGYRIVGYCSVYRYNILVPKKGLEQDEKWTGDPRHRCRISQFLILPPYQKMGLGARMLHEIIVSLQGSPKVYEISVESPEADFQRLFHTVTSKCLKKFMSRQSDSYDVRTWVSGLPPHALQKFRKHLKFSRKQIIFCTNVIADEVAHVESGESLREFYNKLTTRIQNEAQEEVDTWERKEKRVSHSFYVFSDLGEPVDGRPSSASQTLRAVWETNLQNRVRDSVRKCGVPVLASKVHTLATMIHEVGKRMDRLDF